VRTETEPKVSLHIATEAAEWIARLHGPDRSRQVERDCLAWQSRSQAHRHAFERCTATWEEVRGTAYPAPADTSDAAHSSLAALLIKWIRAGHVRSTVASQKTCQRVGPRGVRIP